MFYLYVIRNSVNGKEYVGQTNNPDKRWRHHLWCSERVSEAAPLYRAMREYGSSNFTFEVVAKFELRSESESAEIELIRQLDSMIGRRGYNVSTGGLYGGSGPHTEQSKARISAALTGRTISAQTRARLSAAHIGIKQSAESIAKRAASRVGKTHSAETRARICVALKGRKLSPEALASVRASRLTPEYRARRVAQWTPEVRAKASATRKGVPKSEEHRNLISVALKEAWARKRTM